ncbi:MAG: hypothetical protein PVJ92_01650 [Candidatus Dependentiae bacterium]|jgi:hypothetical protein
MNLIKKSKLLLLVSLVAVQSMCGAVSVEYLRNNHCPGVSHHAYLRGYDTVVQMHNAAMGELEEVAPNMVKVTTLLNQVYRAKGLGVNHLKVGAGRTIVMLAYNAEDYDYALAFIDTMSAEEKAHFAPLRGEIVGLLQNESMGSLNLSGLSNTSGGSLDTTALSEAEPDGSVLGDLSDDDCFIDDE